MSSKGNPIIHARIPADVEALLKGAIESRNRYTAEEPWDVGQYLRFVIGVDLAHRERSRRPRGRRQKKGSESMPVSVSAAAHAAAEALGQRMYDALRATGLWGWPGITTVTRPYVDEVWVSGPDWEWRGSIAIATAALEAARPSTLDGVRAALEGRAT